jgi:hypothetical protein
MFLQSISQGGYTSSTPTLEQSYKYIPQYYTSNFKIMQDWKKTEFGMAATLVLFITDS